MYFDNRKVKKLKPHHINHMENFISDHRGKLLTVNDILK